MAATGAAKAKFAKAIEEAKAGVQVLASEAQSRSQKLSQDAQAKAGAYKEQITARSSDWVDEARDLASQARDRAGTLANEGKAKTSDALSSLGKIVAVKVLRRSKSDNPDETSKFKAEGQMGLQKPPTSLKPGLQRHWSE